MDVFTIAPSSTTALWVLVPVTLIMVVVLTVLAVSLMGSRTARFEVSDAGLRLRGDWYGRVIPIDALAVDRAQHVSLAAGSELRPVRRTWGTGAPGYQAGWFRLANGEKALVYVTDRARTVYVPTRLGYSLLLSPAEPDRFIQSLRSAAGRR